MTDTATALETESELEQRLAEPINADPTSQALSLRDEVDYSRALAKADILPSSFRNKPGNVLWAVAYSRALDLEPPIVMQNLTIIDGNVGMKADLIATLVRRAGHRLRQGGHLDENGLPVGWAEIVRKDDPDHVVRAEWDIPRAVRAGLCSLKDGKPYARSQNGKVLPWEAHPSTQVKRRAVGEAARDACPEVMLGVSLEDELDEIRPEDTTPVVAPNQPGGSIREAAEAAAAARASMASPATPAPASAAEDIVDGEVVEDQPVDGETVRNLAMAMTRRGMRDRGSKIEYINRVLGLTGEDAVSSSKDLTVGQAATVFGHLEAYVDESSSASSASPDDERSRLATAIGKAAKDHGLSMEQIQARLQQDYRTDLDHADLSDLSDLLDSLTTAEPSS